MKNAMQLKAHVNNMAKEAGIPSQALMQSYLLERLLERLSRSTWRDNIVIKGGVLISSLVGVSSRTTMDLDTTVRGFALTHDSAEKVFRDIMAVKVDDDWEFELDRIEDIRETDDYPGIRVHLKGSYPPMLVPLTVDVTTGDRITPDAVEYSYPLLFGEGEISLMAYPIETVLAEKLETVVSRGVANTRLRDFYDIYVLLGVKRNEINMEILRNALASTCEKRSSQAAIARWADTLDDVAGDAAMLEQWAKYVRKNPYAKGIALQDCCKAAKCVFVELTDISS
jgi:hypothetical protein